MNAMTCRRCSSLPAHGRLGAVFFLVVCLSCLIYSCAGYSLTALTTGRSLVWNCRAKSTAVAASSGNTGPDGSDGYMVRPYGPGNGGPVGMFGGRGGLTSSISSERELSDVLIEAPSLQSRRISATILVDGEIDEVWKILTDYNNLAYHVPNLVQSYVVQDRVASKYSYKNPNFQKDDIDEIDTDVRIFQEGAQKIMGFDFRANLKMDMQAKPVGYASSVAGGGRAKAGREVTSRSLGFTLADSFMFSAFDGSWTVRKHSRVPVNGGQLGQSDATRVWSQLTYSVLVKPRGPVPVAALEWRIKEDVPTNLLAVKKAVESGAYYKVNGRAGNRKRSRGKGMAKAKAPAQATSGRVPLPGQQASYWDADETLENYLS